MSQHFLQRWFLIFKFLGHNIYINWFGVVGGQKMNVLLMWVEVAEQKGNTNTPSEWIAPRLLLSVLHYARLALYVQNATPQYSSVAVLGRLGSGGRWLPRYSQVSVTDHWHSAAALLLFYMVIRIDVETLQKLVNTASDYWHFDAVCEIFKPSK